MTPTVRRLGPSRVPSQLLPSALGLLDQARRGLQEAATLTLPAERYATAHLAALRGAAAVLAARTRPTDPRLRRRRPTSAWVLLTEVAPELGEWAAFFAAGADLLRDAATFLALVETTLGLVPTMPLGVPRAG